jgi:hypothetical protein
MGILVIFKFPLTNVFKFVLIAEIVSLKSPKVISILVNLFENSVAVITFIFNLPNNLGVFNNSLCFSSSIAASFAFCSSLTYYIDW